jgi:outer membrane protein assembly factor BamB
VSAAGYATPGNTLTISGLYFIPNQVATISIDSTPIATVPVKQLLSIVGLDVGGFWVPYTIPWGVSLGTHTIQAVEQPSGFSAQGSFDVAASWAQYGFSPTNTRFNPYESAISSANVSTLTLAWNYSAPLQYAAPVVVNGDVYFTDGDKHLYARNAVTGASAWTFNTPYSVGWDAPAFYNNDLYFAGQYLETVNIANVTQGWMSDTVVGNYPTIVSGGTVYADGAGVLMAFNTSGCPSKSCAPTWTLTGAIGGPAVSGNTVYAAGSAGVLAADAATGKIMWTGVVAASDVYPGSPVVDGGYVFLVSTASYTASSSTLYAFDASGCGQATCEPLWTATVPQIGSINVTATGLAVANNTVFVNGVGLYAFPEGGCGASSCSPTWIGQTGQPNSAMIDNAPAVANGLVYVGSEDAHVHAFNANGCGAATCQPLWSAAVVSAHMGPPILINGMLYITVAPSLLYAFGLPSVAAKRVGRISAPRLIHGRAGASPWKRPSFARPAGFAFLL